jgi:hypothetical protein
LILGIRLATTHSFTCFWKMPCCFQFFCLHIVWKALYYYISIASTSSSPLNLGMSL